MTPRARRFAGRAGAVALGLALASLPFVRFGVGTGHDHSAGPHADHSPHRGGVLRMVGDHHVELVDTGQSLEVFVSDARRRPLRAASAVASFDGRERPMTWQTDHFETRIEADYEIVEVTVELDEGQHLVAALPRTVLFAER